MAEERAMTLDKARELVADAEIWPRVRDFLWDFAPQIHESWLEGICGRESETADAKRETVSSLVFSLSSSPRIKRYILSTLGVEPFFHDFPKDDWSRLVLLDGSVLLEIGKWLGALVCAGELRRVTDGATVRELKAALPGVYPDVFGFTAYFSGVDFQRGKAEPQGATAVGCRPSIVENVVATGASMLFQSVSGLPAPLVSRLKLKLPSSLASRLPESGRETRDARHAAAVKKLLKLKFPEAYRLCCS